MNIFLLIAIATVFSSAFFSGMEIAFITANRLKIELDKKNRLFSGKVLSQFQKNPADFISTMLLGNTISLVIYGIAMVHIIEPILRMVLPSSLSSDLILMIFQTLISTLLIIFVAEFAPKVLFRINPNSVLRVFILPLFASYYLLFPIQFIFVEISEFILQFIFRVKFNNEKYEFSAADLNHYVREYSISDSEKEKHLPEIQMFQNAIEFTFTKVRECMVPRNEIVAVEENDTLDELRTKFVNSGHSKILVYRNRIDNIVGYVHSFDMFENPPTIKSIKKPVLIVPQSMLAKEILRMFIIQHKSIAVVVDEFGGTSGMVSLEDLIEEITGEINDEFDVPELIGKQIGENEYVLSGRLEIDYLNDKYQLNIPENSEYETLAGFVIFYLERFPEQKESFSIPPFQITILKATHNRIEQIHLIKTNERSILE
ncbi:MAG: hemolysin family protein [Bacteroidota bacterium]